MLKRPLLFDIYFVLVNSSNLIGKINDFLLLIFKEVLLFLALLVLSPIPLVFSLLIFDKFDFFGLYFLNGD